MEKIKPIYMPGNIKIRLSPIPSESGACYMIVGIYPKKGIITFQQVKVGGPLKKAKILDIYRLGTRVWTTYQKKIRAIQAKKFKEYAELRKELRNKKRRK